MLKLVFLMMMSPTSSIWGSTHMTRKMDMVVPLPIYSPMPEIISLEVIRPITMPARAIMAPEVIIVGKARFRVSVMASFRGILSFRTCSGWR